MTTDLCAARWLLCPARALAQPVRSAGIRATAAKTSDDLAPLLADVPPLSSTAAVAIGRGGRDSRSGRLRHPSPMRGGVVGRARRALGGRGDLEPDRHGGPVGPTGRSVVRHCPRTGDGC